MEKRISWDKYFVEIAKLVSKRSTCLRRKQGSVLVRNHQILSTGYCGAPKGSIHCDRLGCLRNNLNIPHGQRYEMCRSVHAEENCIAQAAHNGISTKDSMIYTTSFPCSTCLKLLINSGVKEIVYVGNKQDYFNEVSKDATEGVDLKIRKFAEE